VFFEIVVEVFENVVLEVLGLFAQLFELGQFGRTRRTGADEAVASTVQCLLQVGVVNGEDSTLGEFAGADFHQSISFPSPAIPVPLAMPASTSTVWNTRIGALMRRRRPAMFIRQPRSPPISTSAPVSSALRILSSTILVEISGYLTQKVPPKPQHTSVSAISRRARPSTLASSARGWPLMPRLRRPEQESW